MIVDEDGSLVKSTDVTNLLVDYFRMSMESTGGDASWINVNNERHNKSIHKMFRAGLIDSNQHENNGAVQQKHQQKYVYSSSIFHYTTTHLTLHGMIKNPEFMNP